LITWSVVVPTVGRPVLDSLLADLAAQLHQPASVVVVDDRRRRDTSLDVSAYPDAQVVASGGRGPAAARNVGWRATATTWVVFLDDDIRLTARWSDDLLADVGEADSSVAGVQGAIVVPAPAGRARTDWERSTEGLQNASWATADMAYRREALQQAAGFDERFPRAYREDSDLALRLHNAGWRLLRGRRFVQHPVRAEDFWVSVRVQRGNSDDALMRALHGPQWHALAGCPRGRFRWHVVASLTALAAMLAAMGRRRRIAAATGATWLAMTAELIWARTAHGSRTRDEIIRMLVTSAVIPPVAVWHRARGWRRHRAAWQWPGPVRAVLFDRDGTLIQDVPYNTDPARVIPATGAPQAVRRLRNAGISLGVVTNQSGVGRGLISPNQLAAVNGRVDELLGPFQTWQVCPHTADDGCACRKPAPGMILAAAEALGVPAHQVVVIGDIGADVRAAESAGARSVMVPNGATRSDEVSHAPMVAPNLTAAVEYIMRSRY
jgi:histidinol-phosphate phosphatase family protein